VCGRCHSLQGEKPYFVLKVTLGGGNIEPAVHGQHADVKAVQFEGGAEALADCFSTVSKRRQQPHL
jgi:hypothetical protein